MLSVALTGNIAAGKTTVARLFHEWGATVIDADRLAQDAQAPGGPVLARIVGRFGPGTLRPDASLDRAALRRAALAEARARGDRIVVTDIPLLFEADDPTGYDAIVLVDAPAAVRRDRIVRERGLGPDEADRMLAAQAPAEGKRSHSDFVIENAGSRAELERVARTVWLRLEARAEIG